MSSLNISIYKNRRCRNGSGATCRELISMDLVYDQLYTHNLTFTQKIAAIEWFVSYLWE